MSEYVYLKCEDEKLVIYAKPLRPFLFEPYLRLDIEEYVRWASLLNYSGTIRMVTEAEYDAWAEAKAQREAEIHFCGDCGGKTTKGSFCWKRVDAPGMRCEHHGGNDPEFQGKYEERVERPAEGK